MNTTVTINYADGSEHTFAATDAVEARILSGDMFTVSALHPQYVEGIDQASKMYAGNPLAALGHMLMLRAELLINGVETEAIDHCIQFMAQEMSS